MNFLARSIKFSVIMLLAGAFLYAPLAKAQQRMNDKDIQNSLKNIKDDAKIFRSSFDAAIKKSTIRKTSQEEDARTLVKRFEDQTAGMLTEFKQTKKVDNSLPVVLSSSEKIDKVLASVSLGSQVTSQWARVKTELGDVSKAFHVAPSSK